MSFYRYTLNSRQGKYKCPSCKHEKCFTRYVEIATGVEIADDVGICDRKNNCQYHKPPREHKSDNYHAQLPNNYLKQPAALPSFIPFDHFKASLTNYEQNNLVGFLHSLLDPATTKQLIERYYIGTSTHWKGANVFWQIDIDHNIRGGKIMLYHPVTGRRSKDDYHKPTWLHSIKKLPDFKLQQCLFGEHLLKKEPNKRVAIVESEKTALIANVMMPEYLWLACGGGENLTERICRPLAGRKVVLFPDLKYFDRWQKKASDLSRITNFIVSDYLEKIATVVDKEKGYDLADYLIPVLQAKKAAVLSTLMAELVTFCNQFAKGEKTLEENRLFTQDMERRVKAAGISLDNFVAATTAK